MRTTHEYIDTLRAHVSELQTRFGISSMHLFGSVARGEQKEGSDVDVFVEMPPVMYNACAAVEYLEDLLGCKVDLIRNHRNIRASFLSQIEEDGILIFKAA